MNLTRKLLDTSSVALADQRQVEVICSTGEPDRMGDVIVQNGIDLTAYKKNPVVLWGHSADVPIAKAVKIEVKNGKLQATVQFPPEGDDEDADWVYGKIKAGIVNATSVGFIPKDYEPLDPKQPWGGFKFLKSELLEFSFVSIPANAGCLIVGRSLLNAVDMPLLPSLAKSKGTVETPEPSNVSIPRNVLEEVFRLAKTPRTIRQKYLAKAETSEWTVGAADDLSIVDSEAWDGAAAAKRILDDAGFDGDAPDVAKAARGFLLHDAANPVLRSSYKLPFADIVGGELMAVKAGVLAAKGRLDQTVVPPDVLDQAKEIAAEYEAKEVERLASVERSGRKISSANAALLQKAMDHHASATQCIKDVLGSNDVSDPDGDDDKDPDGDAVPEVVVLSAREQRLAEAKALRESANL